MSALTTTLPWSAGLLIIAKAMKNMKVMAFSELNRRAEKISNSGSCSSSNIALTPDQQRQQGHFCEADRRLADVGHKRVGNVVFEPKKNATDQTGDRGQQRDGHARD